MQGASYTDETTLLRDVAQRLHELARADHPPIVSIDGVGGAGKTTLAMRLAQLVGYQVVSFDDYVTPHKGSYLDHIDYPRLNRELERLRSTGHGVIVEGLLARAVLIQIEVAQDLSVYMRRVDPYGEWEDSSICSEDNDLEEVFGWLDTRSYAPCALVEGRNLTPVDPATLASLQSEDRLIRRLAGSRHSGYVNNVFFLPKAQR